jgi:TrmH family RNA methyltransferase
MLKITSLDNNKIKEVVSLQKNKKRQEAGLILVDGFREIILAKQADLEIIDLFYCPDLTKKGLDDFSKLEKEKIVEVSEAVFKKICYKEKPDGLFAIIRRPGNDFKKIKLSKKPLVLVLEAVEKPGNLGAIIRTAYAAGVEAIIINNGQTDIYNPNVIRASEGLIFFQPVFNLSFDKTIKFFKDNKIKSFAAGTKGSKDYLTVNYSQACALVLGSEDKGLSDNWLEKADQVIKIEMQKGIDSLNVSVSGAIIVYEALRQRKLKISK